MQINVAFDLSSFDRTAKRFEKNLAYSAAQAINASALEAQKRIRQRLREVFHIRRADFMDRSVKIFAFANIGSNRPYAEIGIDNKARLLLSMFESGGARVPFKGRSVAVPITGQVARPGIGSSVDPAFTFSALHFQRGPITARGRGISRKSKGKHKTRGQYYVWQGANRTFILPHTARAPYGGVFQRVGPGRDDIRLLYSFRRGIQLKAVLHFVETTQAAYQQVFQDTFVRKFYRLGAQ